MNKARLCGAVSAVAVLAACVPEFQKHELVVDVPQEELDFFLADKPADLHGVYTSVLTQGPRNAVLNNVRAGLAAMEKGEIDLAGQSFDSALNSIEVIYADNETAKKARTKFVKENLKDFKGEPYERAMAFYYRGLLYLMRGDYENARASFRGGMLQDTLAAGEEYAQDFASLAFLDGWASQCNGNFDLAKESFAEAKQHNPEVRTPTQTDNLLLVAETGLGPVKAAGGEHKELLVFERSADFADRYAVFFVNGSQIQTRRVEDVFWQATTRGGREIDGILANQAKFKDGADGVGDALIASGLATSSFGAYDNNQDVAAAGAVMAIAGLFAKGLSAATRPDADTRYWDNLPDGIHVATTSTVGPAKTIEVAFLDETGAFLGMESERIQAHNSDTCSIAWVRAHPADAISAAALSSVAVK